MESFAFPAKTQFNKHWDSAKVQQVVLLFTGITWILPLRSGLVLKEKCMNKKARPQKHSLVVVGHNGIRILDICNFALEEFGNKD